MFRKYLINFCDNNFPEISIKFNCYVMYTLTGVSHKSVTNSQFVTFLNVTLDFTNGKYLPYMKAATPLFTFTRDQTINHKLLRTFHNPSTNASPTFHMMKNHSSNPHLSIRKPLLTADINTDHLFIQTYKGYNTTCKPYKDDSPLENHL